MHQSKYEPLPSILHLFHRCKQHLNAFIIMRTQRSTAFEQGHCMEQNDFRDDNFSFSIDSLASASFYRLFAKGTAAKSLCVSLLSNLDSAITSMPLELRT